MRYSIGPCLVLTNGTEPLIRRIQPIGAVLNLEYPLSFRVSLDFPDRFATTLDGAKECLRVRWQACGNCMKWGFNVSLASQFPPASRWAMLRQHLPDIFSNVGYPRLFPLSSFPNFTRQARMFPPHASRKTAWRTIRPKSHATPSCAHSAKWLQRPAAG